MLHMISTILHQNEAQPVWLTYAAADDHLLFLNDAVYALQKNHPAHVWLKKAKATHQHLYALQLDVQARGLDCSVLMAEVILLNDDEWVELVVGSSGIQTW